MSCQPLMLVQGLRRTQTILALEAVVMVRSAGLVGRCLLSWPRLPPPKKRLLRFCSCLSPVQNRLSLAPYPLKRECQILLKTSKTTWETKDVGSALFSNLVQFFPCSTHPGRSQAVSFSSGFGLGLLVLPSSMMHLRSLSISVVDLAVVRSRSIPLSMAATVCDAPMVCLRSSGMCNLWTASVVLDSVSHEFLEFCFEAIWSCKKKTMEFNET